jgi:hypothetical protein
MYKLEKNLYHKDEYGKYYGQGTINPHFADVYGYYSKYIQKLRKPSDSQDEMFVGGMPTTLNRKMFFELLKMNERSFKYYVTLKLDGERMLLFPVNSTWYFANRNLDFHFFMKSEVKNVPFFMFDGEMLVYKTDNTVQYHYFIFDVIWYNGDDFTQQEFTTRLTCIEDALNQDYMETFSKLSGVQIHSKPWYPLENVLKRDLKQGLYTYISSQTKRKLAINHGFKQADDDGLIFQPHDTKYVCFGPWNKYSNFVFKWKPPQYQTVDLLLVYKPDFRALRALALQGNGTYQEFMFGIVLPPLYNVPQDLKDYLFRNQYSAENPTQTGVVCEFQLALDPSRLVFKRHRNDKKEPNKIRTCLSVLDAVENPVELKFLEQYYNCTLHKNESSLRQILTVFSDNDIDRAMDIYNALNMNSQTAPNLFIESNDAFCKNLKTIIDEIKSHQNVEFECRMKLPKRSAHFQKGDFYFILSYFEEVLGPAVAIESVDSFYDVGVITIRVSNNEGKIIKTIQSTLDYNIEPPADQDPDALQVKYIPPHLFGKYGLRVSLSSETPTTTKFTKEQLKLVRIKKRYSFQYLSHWRIDLTVSQSGTSYGFAKSSREEFEVEYELLDTTLDPEQIYQDTIAIWCLLYTLRYIG